jgi:hypothetical protein
VKLKIDNPVAYFDGSDPFTRSDHVTYFDSYEISSFERKDNYRTRQELKWTFTEALSTMYKL